MGVTKITGTREQEEVGIKAGKIRVYGFWRGGGGKPG